MRKTLPISSLAVLLAGLAPCSFAGTITTGSFDIGGTIYVTNPESSMVVTPAGNCAIGVACLLWQNSTGTTNGMVDISNSTLPNGDIPLALAGINAANMANLTNPPDVVGSAINVPDFITFNNAGVTTGLTLTNIEPGIYTGAGDCPAGPAAVGQQCTPPGSLFNLVNNPPPDGQASITWVMEGMTTSGSSWVGNFETSFPGIPYQTVLNNLAANGYVSETFSGTIELTPNTIVITSTPEPTTLGLIGTGVSLLLLGKFRQRKG